MTRASTRSSAFSREACAPRSHCQVWLGRFAARQDITGRLVDCPPSYGSSDGVLADRVFDPPAEVLDRFRERLGNPRLTTEQNAVVNFRQNLEPSSSGNNGFVRVMAAAGSGKTTTAVIAMLTHLVSNPNDIVVYAVFNREMQRDAKRKLAGSPVTCRTLDAFAKNFFERHFCNGERTDVADHPTGQKTGFQIFRDLGVLAPAEIAEAESDNRIRYGMTALFEHVWRIVEAYCISADVGGITERHANAVELPSEHAIWHKAKLVALAQRLFDASKDNIIPRTHSVVMKCCQLELRDKPQLRLTEPAASLLFVDEAQDVNAVQADVMKCEAHKCKVFAIGDPAQSIYGFRGATRTLELIGDRAIHTFTLTDSFRFGQLLATLANKIQELRKRADENAELVAVQSHPSCEQTKIVTASLRGALKGGTRAFSPPGRHALICRTNRDAIGVAEDSLRGCGANFRVCILGDRVKHLLGLALDIARRDARKCWMTHPLEYRGECFKNCEDLHDFQRMLDDWDLKAAMKVAEQYQLVRLNILVNSLEEDPKKAHLTIATVHQCKGLEWDDVFIHAGVEWARDFDTRGLSLQVVNQWYVALTRAKKALYVPPEVAEEMRSFNISLPAESLLVRTR